MSSTHQVFNQPSALEEFNTYTSDNTLRHYVSAFAASWGEPRLVDYGVRCGGDLIEAGQLANEFTPQFDSHDRFGHRIDLVKFHPGYHQLMDAAISANMHALPWTIQQSGAHVVRAGMEYQHMQADPGSGCPLTMTFAAVPALKHTPALADTWLPKVVSNQYDYRNVPYFEKPGATIGMAMTEKQGGSDVNANTTRAEPLATDNGVATYSLTGHKWFCSAPMCDAFLTLAQTPEGLSCFLVPRWKPDGSKNPMEIQRLKNKVGNRSNASSEIEYRGAFAWLLGQPGRGVRTIIDMVAMTRFDCMVGSAALMRGALAQALHHTSGRDAFGKNLHHQPLMQNVLADLAIESEASLAISMYMGHALDNASDSSMAQLIRLGTAVGKYWICKRAPNFAYEAMECIGGVGYIEDNPTARIYREAPVNAIWEGSGNIQCLDVLRAIKKEPDCLSTWFEMLNNTRGKNNHFDRYLDLLAAQWQQTDHIEYRSRQLVEGLAKAWQGAVLLSHGDEQIAHAFCSTRLNPGNSLGSGALYGVLPPDVDVTYIMNRATPTLQ